MTPNWFLHLNSFRNESGMKKIFALCKFDGAIFAQFIECTNIQRNAIKMDEQTFSGLARTSLDLNLAENLWSQTKNL